VFDADIKGTIVDESSVARISVTLVDPLRGTPANGSYAGASDRTLETVVSFPTQSGRALEGPLPLVVFATGYGGTATNYAGLYDHWVRAGYVVAAPNFPLSREDAPGGTSGADLASQAGDIGFVCSEVLRLARSRDSELYGLVDRDRVALAGKSFGAITMFDAGYNPSEQVPSVKAVIAMTGVATDGPQFEAIDTPLLLVHGDQDTLVPSSASRAVYERAQSPKFLVELFGVDHVSAFHGGASPAEVLVERTTIDFLERYVKGDASALGRLRHDADVPGVASLIAAP
jgi:dienelactone hydrolase